MDFRAFCEGIDKGDSLPSVPADFVVLNQIPKMSTPVLGALINLAVQNMPAGQCYVNVGVWHGYSLLAGMLGNAGKICIGVDNFSQLGSPRVPCRERFLKAGSNNHAFFEMDSREYLCRCHTLPIGFYFYDGDHSYPAQLDGLKMAEPFFADGCLIMVDDTNQEFPRHATLDFIKQSQNAYEVVFDKMTTDPRDEKWWNGIILLKKLGPKAKEITEDQAEG